MRRLLVTAAFVLSIPLASFGQLPEEPVEIGTQPQFFVDDWIVSNRFAVKYKNHAVVRRFHAPRKHARNPLLGGRLGYVNVVHDAGAGVFRAWYQTHFRTEAGKTRYAIAYAESQDGLSWTKPDLDLHEWPGTERRNVVLKGPGGARASGPQILLSIPEEQKRGYRYVMSYRTSGAGEHNGIRLVGSDDGIHWDAESDTRIKHLHSDTLNSVVYDARRQRYVMFCRAKHVYRTFRGPIIDTGASRRVARVASDELWSEWEDDPQNVLIPDEQDAETRFNFFYGMPTHYHAGIYWGFLWAFRMNDPIDTQLATSRDGEHWLRLPGRPNVVGRGEDGAWDDGMVFAGPHWIEVGDEWWFYYAGWDGPHQSKERKAGLGLATLRKEGLVSLHGPGIGGGVVITRRLLWPGGDLLLNVEAPQGEVRVRLSDADRKVLDGFDYEDCETFSGDSVAHPVRWGKHGMDELRGEVVRLEIFLQNADLYTFRAEGAGSGT